MYFIFTFDEEKGETNKIEVAETDVAPEDIEFFDGTVRRVWHVQEDDWYFSVVDVCQVLTDSIDGRKYWNKLKQRLKEEGNETVTKCHQLKMPAKDGKMRMTDAANTEQLLRIIQSIPSKKAEPFKLWLARVGAERLDEMADPEKAIDRAFYYYKEKGYSDEWIEQRMQGKKYRKELTDEWARVGISDSKDFATLTNIMTHSWSGKTIQEYKKFKGLHKENLRDNMTDIELTLNQLAEVSTTALSKAEDPSTLPESKNIARKGGHVAKVARDELEKNLGGSVISKLNASNPAALDVKDQNK